MPIKIRDLDDGIGNVIKGWGVLTDEEYIDIFGKHLNQDQDKFKNYRYSLLDYTAVVSETKLQLESIVLISKQALRAAEINPDVVIAIVTKNDNVAYNLTRIASLLLNETSWEISLFKSKTEAEKWIIKKVKEKYGIAALSEIETLKGIFPVCCKCKKIQDSQGGWSYAEVYFSSSYEAQFPDTYCQDCLNSTYPQHSAGESYWPDKNK